MSFGNPAAQVQPQTEPSGISRASGIGAIERFGNSFNLVRAYTLTMIFHTDSSAVRQRLHGNLYLSAIIRGIAQGIFNQIFYQQSNASRIDLSLKELVAINFSLRFYIMILPRVLAIGLRWMRYGKGQLSHDALALLGFERAVYLTTMFACALVAVTTEIELAISSTYGGL